MIKFIKDEDAVNVIIGNILNLAILALISGGIIGVFYLYEDSSSQKLIQVAYTDLGNQIAREITNMYIVSEPSSEITLNKKINIPFIIGGNGYRINLSSFNNEVMVNIIEDGFFMYKASNQISLTNVNISDSRDVYSGTGNINITMTKSNGTTRLRIE